MGEKKEPLRSLLGFFSDGIPLEEGPNRQPNGDTKMNRKAFTLIELLVVIANHRDPRSHSVPRFCTSQAIRQESIEFVQREADRHSASHVCD